jgi:hypothetical protein
LRKQIPLIILVLLSFSLIACQPDPRKEADAYATRVQADQDALNQQQNRDNAAQMQAAQMAEWRLQQGHREAVAQKWRNALNNTIQIGSWFVIAALCYFVFFSTRSVTQAVQVASVGISQALVDRAHVRAHLIPLDPTTRQYPALLHHIGKGRFALVNPNANSVMILDTRSEPDRQMIAAMGAVQYVGVLSREAGKSMDPAGVSVIQAPSFDVTGEMVTLAKELVRDG